MLIFKNEQFFVSLSNFLIQKNFSNLNEYLSFNFLIIFIHLAVKIENISFWIITLTYYFEIPSHFTIGAIAW